MTVTTIELSQSLVRLAEQYITARRRSGESLLEAAGYLAEARAVARHGEWLPFLAATGTSEDAAKQLLNIHDRATFDRTFADAVKSNWLSLTTAGLLARPSTPQEIIDQALNGDEPPVTSEIKAAIGAYRSTNPGLNQDLDDEPLTPYEEAMAAQYTERYAAAPATEYVPAPPAMSQAMSVLTSQGSIEWYTPPAIIDMARLVLGGIDFDPASSDTAQAWINAAQHYTAERPAPIGWAGRVWLNPPFDDTPAWVDRLEDEYQNGDVTAAILLVNSAPGYIWWEDLWRRRPVCMIRERLCFCKADGTPAGQAKKGTTIAYYGQDVATFQRVFSTIGRVILPTD